MWGKVDRRHPIGIMDKLQYFRISKVCSKGERPYVVIKKCVPCRISESNINFTDKSKEYDYSIVLHPLSTHDNQRENV